MECGRQKQAKLGSIITSEKEGAAGACWDAEMVLVFI